MEPRTVDADGAMRFVRELRQLRAEAGLDPAELAARAHYPSDVIVAAEAGPTVPDLPVLSAYVLGCGGRLAEWEERWRSLTGSPAAPACLPARPVGSSSLAAAGARVGSSIPAQAITRPSRLPALTGPGPLAVRPAAQIATRKAAVPRAALAATVAAVVFVVGAILMLLRRRG